MKPLRGCIDLAEQESRDALGTSLSAAPVFPSELNMSRENQIPSIPTYNLLGDHQTAGDARENAKRKRDSSSDIESDVGSAQKA